MASLRNTRLRLMAPLALGAIIVGAMFVPDVIAVAVEEDEELGPGLTGALLLLSPYLAFSVAGRRTRTILWLVLLASLAGSTVLGLIAAGSSSTGALIFLWLLPLQIVVALSAAYFSRGAPGPHTIGPQPPERR